MKGWVYEMGIPVVETGDRWHYDVGQKVPLDADRSNVTPAFLRDLRVAVLNATYPLLRAEDATESWVTNALEATNVSKEAVETVMDLRYGTKRVVFDPSDPEANALAMAKGYTVIPGRSLPKEAWVNVKQYGAALPAGRVTPSPKPFSEGGRPLKTMDESDWTPAMWLATKLARVLAKVAIGTDISVTWAKDRDWRFGAAFGAGADLTINAISYKGRVESVYDPASNQFSGGQDFVAMLIHEFGHYKHSNHLDEAYHEELCSIGAKVSFWMLTDEAAAYFKRS
jgi:hypothetical protein